MYTIAPNSSASFAMLDLRDPSLESLGEVHVPRDRADAPAPRPMGLDRLPGGPPHFRVGREVQVVVRAEHHDLLPVHEAPGRVRALEGAKLPVQALCHEVLVLRPHPTRRVSRLHAHASIGNATFPQSPLRITSIALL